ncbi:putative oxidoreductase CzcO [Variovorax sp. SRS16]|uniref:flavin-containing monooxygenase n=1 Tax=Variovorax sp. SRS16 TaxID=282217 RepID=UPI001318A70B|nr:NAD(P)/FAD-dependent oxidoreductase [Variovorax sp. SRS16]VTU13055.1 putative oxidoreductase CzcO [Variovorax sp. SRS16]
MSDEDIVVVGAGPAGLAVSACLRAQGLVHRVLEREADVGSAWRRHYDRLHLHTAKGSSGLPFAPWPADAPRYPSREQVVGYLARYASQHAIAPRFGIEVRRIRRREERFAIDTSGGPLSPRFVVVATGSNAVANRPALCGLERFEGSVMHAAAYRNPSPFIGKRTLVVGCGNSGAEIALDLAEQGVEVAMVVRGPVHVVPRDLLGVSTQQIGVLLSVLPLGLRDAIVAAVMRMAVGDLSQWGVVRPRTGLNRMIEESGRIPLLDIGTIAMIKAERIRVRPAVDEVLADGVRFADGAVHPFEAIVLATGYTPGLQRIVEGFDAIADGHGRPDRFGAESAIPGLFFVGFRNPPTGALREIAIEARRVARALASHAGRPQSVKS